MSSPIALKTRGAIRNALIKIHQGLSHFSRISILSHKISEAINEEFNEKGEVRCLDVGCGDMKIAEAIHELNPKTSWTCIDIYTLPEHLKKSEKWAKYRKFDGENIPFEDKSMDVVIFCDVLHHSGDKAEILLREAARVGKSVIIKDHYEYSPYSRLMLKLMDLVGNWGYGVKIPKRYFTEESFEGICDRAGLKIKNLIKEIDLYSHIPFLKRILKPKWQFIAVLNEKNDSYLQT